MRSLALIFFLATATVGSAQDLAKLPGNTWVEVKYATDQPADADAKGYWVSAGWNKIVYAAEQDCFIGMIRDKIFAFRHDPAR